jgi:hypothetical protein
MKRFLLILLILTGKAISLTAAHIRGGEIYYRYDGPGNGANTSRYIVTLKLYIDCSQNSPGQLNTEVPFTIFSKETNTQYGPALTADMSDEAFIKYDPASNPCISNPPTDVCYRLRYYQRAIELPNNADGYIISYQRCCRIQGIQNIQPPSNDLGATYLCEIPGTGVSPDAYKNSSPLFNTNDAVAICVGSNFTFDFSAEDPDGTDSLVYQLCTGFTGGGTDNFQNGTCTSCPTPDPAAPPPYVPLPYQFPYFGTQPLGNAVNINSRTGIITGVAPGKIGQYVVTACVNEYRNGILINTHRKDIHVKVSDCVPLRAVLNPDYSYCDDFLVSFRNEQVNPAGSVYIWDFGDNSGTDTSFDQVGAIQHQYSDTGTFRVTLKVILAGQCVDSTFTSAKVYPGFFPGFIYTGSCQFSPFQFVDTTASRYGLASDWKWSFGDETTQSDSSALKAPTWLYNSLGLKTVRLIVGSSKGCRDTVEKIIEVRDKPALTLPFTDTLICSIDTLQLRAIGNGIFSWSPSYNIQDANTSTPLVWPKQTTTYTVSLNENGCVSSENLRVRVVDFVTLNAGVDTTICRTDTIMLNPATDGLKFTWTANPTAPIDDPTLKNPLTSPTSPATTYVVEARIGKCSATDAVEVRTIPYPVANAGADTIICYDDTATLRGSMNGSRFVWTPVNTMVDPTTLSPEAFPRNSTLYTLMVYDTLGCPKPGVDQMFLTVRPKIVPFAGNDTAVVVNQPLQLSGSGAPLFRWFPSNGLLQDDIQNPVARLNDNTTLVMMAYTDEGCFALDTINVQVFRTLPDIFVPNAFVPNGKNNMLFPKAVGISKLDYFRVYNRWGQLVFQSTSLGYGWNGRLNGTIQATGSYVWVVSGTDYTGKKVFKKGTAVLIR